MRRTTTASREVQKKLAIIYSGPCFADHTAEQVILLLHLAAPIAAGSGYDLLLLQYIDVLGSKMRLAAERLRRKHSRTLPIGRASPPI
ncbi:hypothetical protein BC351_06160 [Paenibacillus ferrarius]|uniref:Uncharacterized protein n=1 Tax=Paenibacillus ferrarius TaxID=1469647 RepID=A0A1V4HFB9_9BACL|nr:hypothetical protein [Paenibacillus ferrarius]OPH53444.1 hypothetical protein BC351_06160 [Paenibacillus ferrarius]